MRSENITKFGEQIFRRIGYTVGLENIPEFYKICLLFQSKRSLGERELQQQVAKVFEPLKKSNVEGKIDVSRGLGLIFSPPNLGRYALTAHGRTLVALSRLESEESLVTRAFFLWRMLENDADLSLTLFMVLAKNRREMNLDEEFPWLLNALLKFKYEICLNSTLPIYVKKKIDEVLRIHDLKPHKSPFREKRVAYTAGGINYERIEISGSDISTYVRHTTGPRKGWLRDLGLLEHVSAQYRVTPCGKNLIEFLKSRECLKDNFAIIQPEEDVLLDLIGRSTLFETATVNHRFFLELISHVYAGHPPNRLDLTDEEFLEKVSQVYPLVKLDRFEQAETIAIREALEIPYAVKGEFIEFDQLLESCIRRFPNRISTLSSRRARGTYISLKGLAK